MLCLITSLVFPKSGILGDCDESGPFGVWLMFIFIIRESQFCFFILILLLTDSLIIKLGN